MPKKCIEKSCNGTVTADFYCDDCWTAIRDRIGKYYGGLAIRFDEEIWKHSQSKKAKTVNTKKQKYEEEYRIDQMMKNDIPKIHPDTTVRLVPESSDIPTGVVVEDAGSEKLKYYHWEYSQLKYLVDRGYLEVKYVDRDAIIQKEARFPISLNYGTYKFTDKARPRLKQV